MDGKYLHEARRKRGLSQEKLAAVMGISASQLSRYESNDKVPAVDEIERAAEFLRVPFLSLIGPFDDQAHQEQRREKDELFEVLAIVLSALLESYGASQDRIQGFVSSLIAAYETPEALSSSIPADQQMRFLAKSLVRELASQGRKQTTN